MNLLICAATEAEVAPLLHFLQDEGEALSNHLFRYNTHGIQLLITGVGGVATAYALGKILQHRSFDLAVQAGIAGAFSPEVEKGSVWKVSEEHFADLGAEAGDHFTDLFDLRLLAADHPPFESRKLTASPLADSVLSLLPSLPAISVNKVSGSAPTIAARMEKYRPGLESMEGAAFFYVCKKEKVPFIEVRSISNHVEVRDTAKWNIALAVQHLNAILIRFLKEDLK